MATLKLITATNGVGEILAGTLAEHGVGYRVQGRTITIEEESGAGEEEAGVCERIIGVLRESLSGAQREAVSVVEEPESPEEFPVTTRLEAWWSVFSTSWFERAMATDAFSIWFQPVVDATVRRTMGYQCLLRLTHGRRREGDEIMAAASLRRDLAGFDEYARRLALRAAAWQQHPLAGCPKPAHSMYFVNFVASALTDPAVDLRDAVQTVRAAGLRPENVVMQAVSAVSGDVARLRRAGDYLREHGVGFGLADVGTNADAVRMVCELRPDYIRLERRVAERMGRDRDVAAVARLAEIAGRFGARTIAGGVDRVSVMERFFGAGVECMEGSLFGGPAQEIADSTTLDLVHLAMAIEPSADGAGFDFGVGLGAEAAFV